jgi:hypothetical protein
MKSGVESYDLVSYLICLCAVYCERLLGPCTTAAFGPPDFEPSPNARTRIEVKRLDIREVEPRDLLWWLHSCNS